MGSNTRLTMWCGTVRTKSLVDRVTATAAGGFAALSIFPADAIAATAAYDMETIAALGAQAGIDVTVLDPLARWLPEAYWNPPAGHRYGDIGWYDFSMAEFFDIAAALDVDAVTALEPFGTDVPIDVGVEHFGACCDVAAEHDIDVMLEFVATTGISTLETAWEIVRRADRDNGGLLFDTWHYFRGNRDDELLASIPGEKVFGVQLSDGEADIERSLSADMRHHRRLPGGGDFPIVDVVGILADIGGLRRVGPEVFSDNLDKLSPSEVGREAGRATRETLDAAGIEWSDTAT